MPQLSYIAIAPFTGPEAAVDLVQRLVENGGVEGPDANRHSESTGAGDRANRRGSATLQ
jgi:hypothetical protein